MILLDTDHLTVLVDERHVSNQRLTSRLASSGDPFIATTIVTAEEQCKGWLAQINRLRDPRGQVVAYERLAKLFDFLRDWDLVRFDLPAAETFEGLRKQRIRMGTHDLKIAAIALVNDALLLSANLRDFRRVPGLRLESWIE